MLFDMLPSNAFALTNLDDKNGEVMVQNTKAKVITYGLRSMADRKAKILENNLTGLILNIDGQEVITRLIGSFNAYNVLSVYGAAIELKEEKLQILTTLSNLHSPDGRFNSSKPTTTFWELWITPTRQMLWIMSFQRFTDYELAMKN